MRRIHAEANYGWIGAEIEEDFKFDDDATDEDIDREIWEWACERVTTAWREG